MDYEFCPNCDANLTLQKGYDNSLPYWVCKGCGEMLINPSVHTESDIVWVCDQCEAMLNLQEGFHDDCGQWKCKECGFVNAIDREHWYLTEDEYQNDLNNPFKGMPDDFVLKLMGYEEVDPIANREDFVIVRDEEGKLFLRKFLRTYEESIYDFLKKHPIDHMPRIVDYCRGDNGLVVLEEYIEGSTFEELLTKRRFTIAEASVIIENLCWIVKALHSLNPPIIHRDIKPSNLILTEDGQVVLLDMNVAKWQRQDQNQDTRFLGSMHYAAPEQVGFGYVSSSPKTDIYALGVLLNVLITGEYPAQKQAPETAWKVIEKCTKLNPEDRYSDDELISALELLEE